MLDSPLFLIAHKVRGEVAFDVALCCAEMGTPSDPGPWWIIPTSGHRAFPFGHFLLKALCDGAGIPISEGVPPMPEGIRDHYAINQSPPTRPSMQRERRGATLEELA